MKIIHTSDIHLASPLSTRLPSSKVSERVRELTATLADMCYEGLRIGASAMIIAGDLFDSERITKKQLDSALAIFARAENMTFFYLPGNHERDLLINSSIELPENLMIFGKEWTYFKNGTVTVAGRSETSKDMFDTLVLDGSKKNIVVLHGELRDRSAEGGVIGIKDASDKGIDYLALGHYHTYSAHQIDHRGIAVYSGAPEGRGFDEVGELGFSQVDIGDCCTTHKFIPFAKRTLHIRDVDISGTLSTHEIEVRIDSQIADISEKDLVRVNFIGARELELRCDTVLIAGKYKERFYHFEIKDSSKLRTHTEDYIYDKSLRGEFIRLCLADESLSDEEKEKIIHCGLSALAGEAFDE
jgi:DNA repair exonuclease SbcCD nuclease subunit